MKVASEATRGAFRVGSWCVEPALNRLGSEGRTVQLEPKVMEVLVHLASHPTEVVSRDELQEAVWRSPHISEDLPRRAIYELRKVFGDDARRPRYIETIPRAGYRLVAPVSPLGSAAEAAGTRAGREGAEELGAGRRQAAAAAPTPPRGRRWLRYGALAAAVLGVAGVLSYWGLGTGGAVVSREPRITPLTTLAGLEYDPAFSPDGSRVAFLRAADSGPETGVTLHVQLIGGESSLELSEEPAPPAEAIRSPTWSPDGTAIAYLRWRPGDGWGVERVSALGGPARKLLVLGSAGASGLSWSPDGRWLALGLRRRPDEPLALYRLSLDSLELERLTDPPATSVGDQLPVFSPDGRSLAFLRTAAADASEVLMLTASGGEPRAVLAEQHKIADLDWTADGRRLLLAVQEAGRHRIWSLDVETGGIERLSQLGESTRFLTTPRTGNRLVYARAAFHFGVWTLDLASGETALSPALSSTYYDEGLDISPDGRRLALASTRSGSYEIWVTDLDGGRPLRLTSFAGPVVGHPRWLPDGKSIVFDANPDGRFDLWRVGVDGTPARRLTSAPGDHRVPSPSRDGESLYFASNRSGDWQVWRMPAASGPAVQVTRHGGYRALESADGRWLYTTRWQTHGLWRTALGGDGEEERVLGDELKSWDWGNWAVAEAGVYFVTGDASGREAVALYSPEAGAVVRELPLAGTPVRPSLALSPVGGPALLVQLDRLESDLILVDGLGDP